MVFKTTPDAVIQSGGDESVMLVDAKYKTRVGEWGKKVSSADVYEGLAFLRASGAKRLALLYPRPAGETDVEPTPGQATLFERIELDGLEILAHYVEARGLSQRDGFRRFAESLGGSLVALAS